LSRKREYLADAGAVEMTKNSMALASALRKISGNSEVDDLKSDDVKQMFIENKPKSSFLSSLGGLFSTHPPINKRIDILERGL
jgi:heat shock protein HtpX